MIRLQRGFEAEFERFRGVDSDLLGLAMLHRTLFVCGFVAFIASSFLLSPFLGRNFFPAVDGGQILMHVRAPIGTRVEETANRFADIEKEIRGSSRRRKSRPWSTMSASRSAAST